MKQHELKMLLTILIDTYAIKDLNGRGYHINDDFDVKILHSKPEWWANLVKAYHIKPLPEVARMIIAKLCTEKNIQPMLATELLGFVNIVSSNPNEERYKELILKLYYVHAEMQSNKPVKEVLVSASKKIVPIYQLGFETPYDALPVRTKDGARVMNIRKFLEQFNTADFSIQDLRKPEKILQVHHFIEDSFTEDKIEDIFLNNSLFEAALRLDV
jgi:hypothetical protein